MATATKPRKRATKKQPAKAQSVQIAIIEQRELSPNEIDPNPWQPRMDFDAAEIAELASEIQTHGQLQAVLVRRIGTEEYELLAGERRLRAAREAGLPIRADICECTDTDARRIALGENFWRKDLSAIEEACAYRTMIDNGDAAGPTELGELLGINQSTISNRLRLLELPKWWQQKIISREITERHGRAVLPYLGFDSIVAALQEAMEQDLLAAEAPAVSVWEKEIIPEVLRENARSMVGPMRNGMVYDSQRGNVTIFKPDERQASQLGIVEVDGEPLAMNTELWDELQEEHLAECATEPEEEAAETDEEEEPAEAEVAEDADETPAERDDDRADDVGRHGKEATGKDFASRLWAWVVMFYRLAIARYLQHEASEADLLKVAMIALWRWDFGYCDKTAIAAACAKASGVKQTKELLGLILGLNDIDAPKALGDVLSNAFWTDGTGPALDVPAEDLVPIAQSLGIELENAWAAGDAPSPQGYWDLHTKEQLLAIAKELKVPDVFAGLAEAQKVSHADLAKMSKANLVGTLMSLMPTADGMEAGLFMPKEIAKAKQAKK